MEITKLSSKGQVVLPKSIRKAHHWEAGIVFSIEETNDGILLRPIKPFKSTTWEKTMGCASHTGSKKTVKEMEKAIELGVKDRHARNRY